MSVVELVLSSIGVKVDGQYCWDVFHFTISTNVKSYYRVIYNNFVFQQDSVQVHLAFNTVELLQCRTLDFLSLELRPNNSPEF